MTDHDGIDYEWEATVTRIYREVIGEADPQEGTSRQEAFAVATQRIVDMLNSGELFLDPTAAIKAALARADEAQGRAGDSIIKVLATGQESYTFDGDPLLDTVVVLGAGRRKPWRHVTVTDLRDMNRLRYENKRQVEAAYKEWQENFDHLLPSVAQYGTVGEAAAAGALGTGWRAA